MSRTRRVLGPAVLAGGLAVSLAAALAQPAGAATSPSTHASAVVTHKVVVRPMSSTGKVAAGFHVVAEKDGQVDCSAGTPSPVAVSPGALWCDPSAEYAIACWPARKAKTVLCLRDPWSRTLYRVKASLPKHTTAAPKHPVPFGLRLGDGQRCTIRDGGAWGAPVVRPKWVGWYSCTGGDTVWGPRSEARTGGIDTKHLHRWTVMVGDASGKGALHRRTIVRAIYVGQT